MDQNERPRPCRCIYLTAVKLVATLELRSMLEAWFAKFAGLGMRNLADQTAVRRR
jgi:hypothetical protein